VGGDDFLIFCEPELSEPLRISIERAFLDGVSDYYSEEDRARGFLSIQDERGEVRRAQFMNPSIAVVSAASGQFKTTDDLALEITMQKNRVRKRTGSGLFPPILGKKK
jgi:hypothetical protein